MSPGTRTQRDAELPSVGRSLWRSLRLGYQAEPRLLVLSFALVFTSWLPEALGALWLKIMADGVLRHRNAPVAWATAGLAATAAVGWVLRVLGDRLYRRFCDRAAIELEAHVAALHATVATLEHHERPAFLDRLQLLREQVFLLNHLYSSLLDAAGSVARLLLTLGLLVSVHPALFLLGLFAVPTVVGSTWRAGVERAARERAAPHQRLARHLFELGTTAAPAKEIRVGGLGELLVQRNRRSRQDCYREVNRARWTSAVWQAATWGLFGCAYAGAVIFVASVIDAGPGDTLLALAAGANLSRFLGMTVGHAEFLRWTIDATQRLVWLEDYAAAHTEHADQPVPDRLRDGVRLEGVSFRYPGTDRWVLQDIDLHLRAGSVVALVGENGAGKTTLVKLLCKLYEPTVGQVMVEGLPLSRLPTPDWRRRLSGAFQDFFRFEHRVQEAVGIGDLDVLDDRPAVLAAIERAAADDVLDQLPAGLDSQLGPTWSGGVELSVGQWQKLALARGLMRGQPLLCLLDEPTASLDAETEHALFDRFAMASRTANGNGRITVLVSHRFSTVRMADHIVVLDGARVVEQGSHVELLAHGGLYAELYRLQEGAYR